MVLGVESSENPAGIRAAYRDLAKRLHPDLAGEQSTPAFIELNRAYDVLSDADRRQHYNEWLRSIDASDDGVLKPHHSPPPVVREHLTILGEPEAISPSFEAMYERFQRNFTGVGVPKSEHLEALNFEVFLTPAESAWGCVVPLGVPVFLRCPHCGGLGHDGWFPCIHCRQQGLVEFEQTVRIRIPPLLPSGSVLEVSLQGLGIHNFYLRLHIVLLE